jgi:hypothetical protein
MKFLIRLKSWQLFLMTIFPFFITSETFTGKVISLFSAITLSGWIYSLATVFANYASKKFKRSINYYKSSFAFIILYFAIFIIFLNEEQTENIKALSDFTNSIGFFLVLTIVFYNLWCIFYIFYFTSQVISSANQNRILLLKNRSVLFIALIFFPIGIWYLQPKLKYLLETLEEKTLL